MTICALCKNYEANKKNTHYLTDGIIRTCLNADGSNKREKGLYFNIGTETPFIEVKFQRLSSERLEKAFKRPITDDEIEESKKNIAPFSVNDIFCKDCEETIFTPIESEFQEKILPLFRSKDLTKDKIVQIEENRLFRLFFLLQIWRNSICEKTFFLPEKVQEKLRKRIYDHENIDDEDLTEFPLSITYLETIVKPKKNNEKTDSNESKVSDIEDEIEKLNPYTENMVGSVSGANPYIILMNDFIIQLYDEGNLGYYPLFGINSKDDYKDFINQNEDLFKVKIVHDNERKEFLKNYRNEKKRALFDSYIEDTFTILYHEQAGIMPDNNLVSLLKMTLSSEGFVADKYSEDNVRKRILDFINKKTSEKFK